MKYFGALGIAGSTAISGVVLSVLYFYFLSKRYNFNFYYSRYFNFLARYTLQLIVVSAVFYGLYLLSFYGLSLTGYYQFFRNSFGFWLVVMPLAGIAGLLLYKTSRFFGIKLYFLSK